MATVRGYRRRRPNRWPGLHGACTAIAAHDGTSGNAGATGCLVTPSAMAPRRLPERPWSTLRVTFPVDEPTHCPTHVYYLDAAHLIRRLDYVAEPIGRRARAAHFCADYRESRGLRVPTRRWVVPRTRDDRAVSWPPLVQIRITAI